MHVCMYECMQVCMYACMSDCFVVCLLAFAFIRLLVRLFDGWCVCSFICAVCLFGCLGVRTCIHTNLSLCVYVCACVYIHIQMCASTHVHAYVRVHTDIHTFIRLRYAGEDAHVTLMCSHAPLTAILHESLNPKPQTRTPASQTTR